MVKKKDFTSIVKEKENNNDIGAITRSMFSDETLNKNEIKPREKRKYTKLASKENKTKTVSIRMTEKEYNELLRKAEKSQSGTITNYIMQLVRGFK